MAEHTVFVFLSGNHDLMIVCVRVHLGFRPTCNTIFVRNFVQPYGCTIGFNQTGIRPYRLVVVRTVGTSGCHKHQFIHPFQVYHEGFGFRLVLHPGRDDGHSGFLQLCLQFRFCFD